MIKSLFFASLFVAGAAQAMPYAPRMTCDQARALVSSQGAIVLRTSPTTYDRYVADFSYCSNSGDETLRPAYIVTADTEACFVGYTCSQDNRGGGQ